MFLTNLLAKPTLRQALALFEYVAVAFTIGLIFTLFLLPYPMIYVPALGLV